MKTFIIEHPVRGRLEVQGKSIQVDGMGTRIIDDADSVVFTSPNQLEVYEKTASVDAETQE